MNKLYFLLLCLVGCGLWGATALAGPLHDAARNGDIAALERLLDAGGNLEERDASHETPLLTASLAGHADIVAELLKRGADLTARNDRGLTPLHAASYGGDLATVKLLAAAGADVNNADNKFKVTPLILSVEQDKVDVTEFLIANGADIEREEVNGFTALTRAGDKAHWDMVAILLKDGAKCQPEARVGWWNGECNKRLAELPK